MIVLWELVCAVYVSELLEMLIDNFSISFKYSTTLSHIVISNAMDSLTKKIPHIGKMS